MREPKKYIKKYHQESASWAVQENNVLQTQLQVTQVTQWLREGLSQAAHLGISSATYKVYEVKDLTEERKEHSEQ